MPPLTLPPPPTLTNVHPEKFESDDLISRASQGTSAVNGSFGRCKYFVFRFLLNTLNSQDKKSSSRNRRLLNALYSITTRHRNCYGRRWGAPEDLSSLCIICQRFAFSYWRSQLATFLIRHSFHFAVRLLNGHLTTESGFFRERRYIAARLSDPSMMLLSYLCFSNSLIN